MFDPFEVLGMAKQYALDLKTLEKHYFEEQKKTHPDRFVGAPQDKMDEVLKRSSEVNQAYILLKDPLQRALFLMKGAGIEPLSHDPTFLSEVMIWNERLENGENLKLELHHEKEILFKDLEVAFEKNDYERARATHYRLTYVQKLLKDILKNKNWIAAGPSDPRNDENMGHCERSEAIQE